MIYVEQLERTKDDGDVKVMSTQSVCDLIEIEASVGIQMKSVGRRTNDRTDAKIGMNVISAIKLDLPTLEHCLLSWTPISIKNKTYADMRIVLISFVRNIPIC